MKFQIRNVEISANILRVKIEQTKINRLAKRGYLEEKKPIGTATVNI